nr:MBL fold metallo-hydrolase [Ardenticatenales bacterium]
MSEPDLLQLEPNIYAYPGEMRLTRPWVGVVVTPEGTVLIDSGNGPRHAEAIQAELQGLNAPPVSHILLTHHHWDHVFGNCTFPTAHIVAHDLTQKHLHVMESEPWSAEYVEAQGERFPRGKMVALMMKKAIPDWSSFRAVAAHETFTERYELRLGGYHFVMEHVGGQHEPDHCIVHVTPGNVLFLGDATYGRGMKVEWNLPALAETMQGFLATGAAWFVEGHRPPVQ